MWQSIFPKRAKIVVDGWDSSTVRSKLDVEPQEAFAIVDGLGRLTCAQAILFSPLIRLTPQEGELINATLYANKEIAEKMLASAKDQKDFHVIPYKQSK